MKKCGDCLIMRQNQGICPVFQEKMNPTEQSCHKYIGHDSPQCDFCGTLMPFESAEIVIMDEGIRLACSRCGNSLGTCATCAQAKVCDFETNPINIPKQIPRVIRQGNMQMQTVIRNPEREKETCMKGCPCWDEENCMCLREVGMCKSWREPNA